MENNSAMNIGDWAMWISKQEARTLNVYREDPDRLIGDYRREKQISRDYQGREILELIQNANDAAAEWGVKGKIRIELHMHGLIVANTGKPFSTDGINSLRVTDISPKYHKKIKYIGQKGLGFRAVLNWTKQPIILSGALQLTYSSEKHKEVLDNLIQSNSIIKNIVEDEPRAGDEIILAKLPFPIIINEYDNYIKSKPEKHKELLSRCTHLRNEYDTVIGMTFDHPEAFDLAKKEIYDLRPEILLFTENIDQLTVYILENETHNWKIPWDGDIATLINHGQSTDSQWEVYRETNTIPFELSGESLSNEYQIVIAVPVNNIKTQSNFLFSYFPLHVEFPFPLICHATFELDTNRKHPQSGNPNQIIFDRIAVLVSEIAESRRSDDDRWIKARIVARMSSYDTVLQKFNFEQKLLESLKDKKIIPTIDKSYKTPLVTKKLTVDDLNWLPHFEFSDICIPTDEYRLDVLLDDLNVSKLDTDEFRERVNKIRFTSIKQRAIVISNLLKHNVLLKDPTPNLLIDMNHQIIKHDHRVYLLPEHYKKYDLPSWVNLKFLNESLRELLSELLSTKDRRELQQRLDVFKVREYSLSNIASAIVAEARRQIESDEQAAIQIQKEMIRSLYTLFPQNENPPKLAETTGVPLKNLKGSLSDSREMYFSEYYSENGDLLSALYKNKPEKLVAPLNELNLQGNDPRVTNFLKWLGVNSFPRVIYLQKVEREFLDFVLESIQYPINLDGYNYKKNTDFNNPSLTKVKSIDCIDEILKGDPAAILTWLAIDNRASNWTYHNPDNAELSEKPYKAQYVRRYYGNISSYIYWKIKNTKWLPTGIETIEKPTRCLLGERGLEKLFPPPLEYQHKIFDKYQIGRLQLRKAFENAGVIPDISYLEPIEILRILNELSTIDPEGKNARTLYRNLLEKIDLERLNWPELPNWFLNNCKMWGKGHDGNKYYPIREMHHADYDDFPQILYNHLSIVDLPKKVGAHKVRRLFGIEPIERKNIKRNIDRVVALPESNDIQFQFNRVKPYIYALRQVRTKKVSDIGTFKDLEITLCSTINITLIYEELELKESFEIPHQWILEENKAYILYSSYEKPSLESDLLADTIGSIIARSFNIAQGGDFARLIRCSERNRDVLLKKMLGEEEIPDIDLIKKEFDRVGLEFPMELPPPPKLEESFDVTNNNEPGDSTISDHTPEFIVDDGCGKMEIKQRNHIPKTSTVKRAKILRKSPVQKNIINRSGLKRITDWNVCEERAIQFEKFEKRVALSVSGLTGFNGPRCDIISFSKEEHMKRFLSDDGTGKRDLSLVSRFIEVKGRGSDNTPISLKGNELDAARTYGDKYFLYRLYQESQDKYVLDILSNPLNHEEAFETVIDIYINRAQNVESYELHLVEDEKQSS